MKTPEEESTPKPEDLLEKDSKIQFLCRPGLSCFTTCCQDVNIFLTPYDILRMKDRLGIPSHEFLDKYTKTLLPPGPPIVRPRSRWRKQPGGCSHLCRR